MHPDFSPSLTVRGFRKVLVFGERATSALVSEQLSQEGLDPYFQNRPLPRTFDQKGLESIRTMLHEFSLFCKGEEGMVHPGVTPWAERPELPSIAQEFGLIPISPSGPNLALFGNKLSFLSHAAKLGIPNLILGMDPIHSVREINEFIRQNNLSFPFILRSIKGGGRFGRFLVQEPKSLERSLNLWCEQLRRNQGEVILFVERYLEGARHVTLPFTRFQDGRVFIFPLSDSSLQCHSRKLIEFCPATRISLGMRKLLTEWTHLLSQSCSYVGLGAFEFLVDSSRAFLVDGLPRLNTSFHLWNHAAGTRGVAWQIATLYGHSKNSIPAFKTEKHWIPGISLRICAEDSLFQLPNPGVIHEISNDLPASPPGTETRLSLNYKTGDSISYQDSGLFGLLFVFAQNRKHLLSQARTFLNEFWMSGSFQTNEHFLLELLNHPWLKEGIFHSAFIDEEFLPAMRPPPEYVRVCAAICAQIATPTQALRWSVGEQWLKYEDFESTPLIWTEGPFPFSKSPNEFGTSGKFQLSDGSSVRVCAFPLAPDRWLLRIGSWYLNVREEVKKRPRLSALVTGRVHAIFFRPETKVNAHDTLLIVESMGVFVPHALPIPAKVLKWQVKAEDIVQHGQELAEISL